jgi:hypothetical protein
VPGAAPSGIAVRAAGKRFVGLGRGLGPDRSRGPRRPPGLTLVNASYWIGVYRLIASMAKKTHGRVVSGAPITDELVSKLAKQAEVGYDVEKTLRQRGGRPPIGSAAASVESVRLEPSCVRHWLVERSATMRRPPR